MELTLNPCTNITSDAIGKPGQRVFYIQGTTIDQQVTLIIEKIQVQTLSASILQFLVDLEKNFPDLEIPSGHYSEETMRIVPPVDPLFRVGEISLAYNHESDQACVIVKEITMDPQEAVEDDDRITTVNFWCSREQIKSMANWGLELVQKGRPICPLCHEPISPDGHFCPKKNGHNRH
ncbi:MAG: hypothetical protein BGO78_00185 [Chloroflexi bacterium 44-23]|nr:MAG: hypothetical protein BGO78_00185 [Chloroflexi bacterium 44-23]